MDFNLIFSVGGVFVLVVLYYYLGSNILREIIEKRRIKNLCYMFGDSRNVRIFLSTLYYMCYPFGKKDVILFAEIEKLRKHPDIVMNLDEQTFDNILLALSWYKIVYISGNKTVALTNFGFKFYINFY